MGQRVREQSVPYASDEKNGTILQEDRQITLKRTANTVLRGFVRLATPSRRGNMLWLARQLSYSKALAYLGLC